MLGSASPPGILELGLAGPLDVTQIIHIDCKYVVLYSTYPFVRLHPQSSEEQPSEGRLLYHREHDGRASNSISLSAIPPPPRIRLWNARGQLFDTTDTARPLLAARACAAVYSLRFRAFHVT